MNTMTKQVTEMQAGDITLALDDEKLRLLADVCDGAAQQLQYLTEEMERLIRMTDNFAGLETEAFPLLRTICDVKSDYRMLMTLCVGRKEVSHGRD